MNKILDAAWKAYCEAPTARDMGRSKVDAAVKAAIAESGMTPVYCVPTDRVSDDGKNILWEHHSNPVPLADNCVLFAKPDSEVQS